MALDDAGLRWLNEGLPQFMRGLQQASGAMDDVGDRSERAGGGLNVLGGVVAGVSMAVATLAIDITTKLAKAIVGIGVDAVKVAADFESLTAGLQIAGKAAAETAGVALEDLDEIALAVGGDTRLLGVSATGAASAMTGLFKSGLSLEEVLGDVNAYMEDGAQLGGALRASIDLAAASSLDMTQAADLASVVMATFGGQARDAGISTDMFINAAMNNLVMAADASVAEVEDLAEALAYVGPTAAQAGFSIEDTNNALAILSTAGIAGSRAGTSLEAMIRSLISPSDEAADKMDELGIAIFDQEGAMLPLVDIIGQLEVALEGATDEQRSAAMGTLFTAAGQRAANVVLREGVEGWYDMAEATARAATIQEQAARRAETFAGKMEALEGTVETVKVRIGTALLPVLSDLAGWLTEFVDEYGPRFVAVFEAIGKFLSENVPIAFKIVEQLLKGEFSDAFDYAATIISLTFGREAAMKFYDFKDSVMEVVTPIRDWIVTNWPAIRDTVLGVFETIRTWVAANWPAIQDTIVEALGGVREVLGEIPGSIVWIIENFSKIKDWVVANWPYIQGVIVTVWEVLSDAFETVRDIIVGEVWPQLQEAWNEIRAALEVLGVDFGETGGVFKTVAIIIGSILVVLLGVVSSVVAGIARVIRGLAETWRKTMENIKGFIEGIAEVFGGVAEIIKGIVDKDMKRVQRGILTFWKGIWKTVKNFVGLIVKGITLPFKIVLGFLSGFVDTIIKFFKKLKDKLVGRSIIVDMMDKIQDVIEGVLESVAKFVERILKGLADTVEKIFSSIASTVERILGSIEKTIDRITDDIAKTWETFVGVIEDAWEGFWSVAETVVSSAKTAIEGALGKLTSAIGTAWDTFISGIATAWNTMWNSFSGIIDMAREWVWAALDLFIGMIMDAWSGPGGLIESLSNAWNTFWEGLSAGVERAWSFVITAISDGLASIQTWLTTNIERAMAMGATIVEGIASGLSEAWSIIVDAVEAGIDAILTAVNFLGSLWVKITTIGAEIVQGIRTGLASAWNLITTRIGELLTNIISVATGIWDIVVREGRKIVDAIIQGLESAWGKVIAWLTNALSSWLCDTFGICDWPGGGAEFIRRGGARLTEAGAGAAWARPGGARLAGALPAFAMTTAPSVDRSRTVTINMDQSFLGGPQEADTFILDVQAALAAARV